MSYSIIAKAKNGSIIEIPVSTHEFFNEYWLPLFEKYRMIHLSNWKFPHDFEETELRETVKEWEKLLPYIQGDWENERARFIISQLKEIQF